jgi:hypothetical protein
MTKVAQSYEMVRNFNNFKAFVMFAVKKLEVLLILVENAYVSAEYAYVSAEKFLLTMLTLVRKIFLTPPPVGNVGHTVVQSWIWHKSWVKI